MRVGDLREPSALDGTFDLVTGTPPYLPRGTATEPARADRGPWHFEHRGGIEDYCRAAARRLAPGAPFVVCAGTLQDARVGGAAATAGLHVVRRRDVVPRAGKGALFARLRHARGDRGGPVAEPPLVVRDARERGRPRSAASGGRWACRTGRQVDRATVEFGGRSAAEPWRAISPDRRRP